MMGGDQSEEAMPDDCAGIPFTVEDADNQEVQEVQVRMMLAHAIRCPLCADWVTRWRLENGLMIHERRGDPGE